jgi:hypothetical protein
MPVRQLPATYCCNVRAHPVPRGRSFPAPVKIRVLWAEKRRNRKGWTVLIAVHRLKLAGRSLASAGADWTSKECAILRL